MTENETLGLINENFKNLKFNDKLNKRRVFADNSWIISQKNNQTLNL